MSSKKRQITSVAVTASTTPSPTFTTTVSGNSEGTITLEGTDVVASKAKKPMKPTTSKPKCISKTAAAKLVTGPLGKKFFTVTFMEKNKSKAKNAPERVERKMTCLRGVAKHTKAGIAAAKSGTPMPATKTPAPVKDLALLGMVSVYEMTGNKGYKTLDLSQITALKIGGANYKVK